MAITTYENRIPPSLEHLVWGGGKDTNGTTHTGYIGGSLEHEPGMASGFVYNDNDYIYPTHPYSAIGIARFAWQASGERYRSYIVEYDSTIVPTEVTSDMKEYIEAILPESWLMQLLPLYRIYALPIR